MLPLRPVPRHPGRRAGLRPVPAEGAALQRPPLLRRLRRDLKGRHPAFQVPAIRAAIPPAGPFRRRLPGRGRPAVAGCRRARSRAPASGPPPGEGLQPVSPAGPRAGPAQGDRGPRQMPDQDAKSRRPRPASGPPTGRGTSGRPTPRGSRTVSKGERSSSSTTSRRRARPCGNAPGCSSRREPRKFGRSLCAGLEDPLSAGPRGRLGGIVAYFLAFSAGTAIGLRILTLRGFSSDRLGILILRTPFSCSASIRSWSM